MKQIGILGGLGPAATAATFVATIRTAQAAGAVQDTDFPRISVVSTGIPTFDELGFGNSRSQKDTICHSLANSLRQLEPQYCQAALIAYMYWDRDIAALLLLPKVQAS